MRTNKILEKLLAIILIFTLTSANFLFVGSSYAASIFGNNSDTGNANVEFDAYFETEEEKSTSVISDVKNQDLAVSMDLGVHDSGYLKDATIAISESEEGAGLNFNLKASEELTEEGEEVIALPEYVQSIEDNVLTMQQINADNDVSIIIPVEFNYEKYMNENDFSKDFKVVLTGTYIDDKGEENEISKEVTLNISWVDDRTISVDTSVQKYIDYTGGVIIQTLVRLNSQTSENTLPVKSSNINIDVPSYNGVAPTKVNVAANSTQGTNGKSADSLVFNEENWNYDAENGKLNITVNNEKELVTVDEFEDEYLKEADREVVEEERYYNVSSYDEYLVTYTYENVQVDESIASVSANVEANLVTFSGVSDSQNEKVTTINNSVEYPLEGKIGEIVSLNIETQTSDVSKAYSYANYVNSNRYEVELKSNTILNISYKDIVNGLEIEDVENIYIDKQSNSFANNDIYYKQISISKDNFSAILGDEGYIKVLDVNGNEIFTINNETEVNEEGYIVLTFNEKYEKLKYKVSKPINEGNLVINNVKAYSDLSIDRQTLENVLSTGTRTMLRADYSYVEGLVEVGMQRSSTTLNDTNTKASIEMDRDNLSTLATNDDVELRVVLNNAEDTSDMYGNSSFEITLPESIESFEITNASLLYGEGLNIASVNQNDRTITVELTGNQEEINSGVLTNGTNIVLNANVKVDLYTPAKDDVITLNYNNSEATAYQDGTTSEAKFEYSAPTGVVAVNAVSNYSSTDLLRQVASVRQGDMEDLIDIYSQAKTVTEEVIVMNNNSNTISNISILGRIPFEGVKDIATGEDLGTTLDTVMVSGIKSDEHNQAEFQVYYSENKEATKDLNDESNGWVLNPTSLENMKSYLIVPVDSNYEMQESEILRFTYEYQIPENLAHNENIYGTFMTYYTNNSPILVSDETATPDLVGLTTGEGPELEITSVANKNEVKEYGEFEITTTVKNVGENAAEDIITKMPVPTFTEYVNATNNKEATTTYENGEVVTNLARLEAGDSIEITVTLMADKLPSVSEYSRKVEVVTDVPDIYIEPKATVSAKDLGTTLEAYVEDDILVTKSEMAVTLSAEFETEGSETEIAYVKGDEEKIYVSVENLTDNDLTNVVAEVIVPNEFNFVQSDSDEDYANNPSYTYDEATRTIRFEIGTLEARRNQQINLKFTMGDLAEGITRKDVSLVVTSYADNTDKYESAEFITVITAPDVTITQTTSTENTYVKEGDVVTYIFNVKNNGEGVAKSVKLTDVVPDGLRVQKITYTLNGFENTKYVANNEDASITVNLSANSEMTVKMDLLAQSLNGADEKSVTNYATVVGKNIDSTQSNEITHIVEQNEEYDLTGTSENTSSTGNVTSNYSTSSSNIEKTYKIAGKAWLDLNQDGVRDAEEELLSGITVKLVNSESGIITKSAITDSQGSYSLSAVNGNYLLVFDYDTVLYTTTAYQKDGVASNVNSDVVTTQVEQDGKIRNAAITDTISIQNGSVSNIDIGLMYAQTFDLSLTQSATKITTVGQVNGSKDVSSDALPKYEIASKYIVGTTVYVEYAITVKNEGEVAGYAKKIVDYIPEGMSFNSSQEINDGWYTGTDGNLYYDKLENTILQPGESQTIKLLLSKQMTEDNTGLIDNMAEIYEDYNIYGISDKNSTPNNKAQGENDLDTADVLVLIKTGEHVIYFSVIITTVLLGGIIIWVAYAQIVAPRRKRGV